MVRKRPVDVRTRPQAIVTVEDRRTGRSAHNCRVRTTAENGHRLMQSIAHQAHGLRIALVEDSTCGPEPLA